MLFDHRVPESRDEALRAVRQGQFEPARRLDEPVAARVAIELAFSMR